MVSDISPGIPSRSYTGYTEGMHLSRDRRFVRTDIWREGQWVDLWSVVHLFSGVSLGFGLYLCHFGTRETLIIGFLLLVGYELWEHVVDIVETTTNRVMDVVVGMVAFVPTYVWAAPHLSRTLFVLLFGLELTGNIVLSVFGWAASKKASALEARMRERAEQRRAIREARRTARLIKSKADMTDVKTHTDIGQTTIGV